MNSKINPSSLYPLRFTPVYRDYIWGGSRIISTFHRDAPPGIYAESWEVSTRPDGMSVVANGPMAGRPLSDLVAELGAHLLGRRAPLNPPRFPLLIKLIDSRERLSVQVHPDDESAARYGGEAKTEMWYILDAAPNAQVFAGLRPGVDRRTFEDALRRGDLESVLSAVPVTTGDAIFVPGGRVHAIDAGCLLLEVQQNSDTTYRIYDWGRVGHDGRPRQTHVAQALRVIRWEDREPVKCRPTPLPAAPPNVREEIIACPYFRMERWALRTPASLRPDGGSFWVAFVARGVVAAVWNGDRELWRAGTTVLLPAALPKLDLIPTEGPVCLLLVRLGDGVAA